MEIANLIMEKLNTMVLQDENIKLLDVNYLLRYNDEFLKKQLMAYISSHITEQGTTDEKIEFTMISDDDLFDNIQKKVNTGARADVVVLSYCSKEKGTIRALKFKNDDYNVYVTQKTPAIFVEMKKDKKYFYIIKEVYKNDMNFKLDGFKFFEHILNKAMNTKNSVLFHSASVEANDGAVIIVGPKRSGKTTVFMDLIRLTGCKPLAFDKCHLTEEKGNVTVWGMPTRLRVLAGTLSKYGDEMSYLVPKEYKNVDSNELWKGESESKIDMAFDDFIQFSRGEKFVKKSKLKLVVIPNISQNSTNELRLATYEEFKEICDTQVFTPNNPEEDWWSDFGNSKEEIKLMEKNFSYMARYIWENVPVVKVSAASNTKEVLEELKNKYL